MLNGRITWRGVIAFALISLMGFLITPTSNANTLTRGLQRNPWIISDLAGTTTSAVPTRSPVNSSLVAPPVTGYDSSYNAATATNQGRNTATTLSRTPSPNVRSVPKVPGRFGTILNSGLMMLSLGGMFFTGDDKMVLADNPPAGPQVSAINPGFNVNPILIPNPPATTGTYVNRQYTFTWANAPVFGQLTGSTSVTNNINHNADTPTRNITQKTSMRPYCRTNANAWRTGGPFVESANATLTGTNSTSQTLPITWSCVTGETPFFFISPSNGSSFTLPTTGSVFPNTPFWYSGAQDVGGSYETTELTTSVQCTNAAGVTTTSTKTTEVLIAPGTEFVPPSIECPADAVATGGSVKGKGKNSGTEYEVIPEIGAGADIFEIPKMEPCVRDGTCYPNLEIESPTSVTRTDPDGRTWSDCTVSWAACINNENTDQRTPTNTRCRSGEVILSRAYCDTMRPNPSPPNTVTPVPPPPFPPLPPPIGEMPNDSGSDCWPSGWAAFNPLEWVYRPIVCALEYLFIPNDFERWTEDAAAISDKPPVSFFITARDYWDGFETSTACVKNDVCADRSYLIEDASGIVQLDPFEYAIEQSNNPAYQTLRQLGIFAIWACFVWWLVNRISASFGGQATSSGTAVSE